MVREAERAQSKADFIHKLSIAQKEANETMYWIELLFATSLITKSQFDVLLPSIEELLKMITSSIKTAKSNLK
jgi:four helix bundle protein